MRDIIFEWNPWWGRKYGFEGVERELLNDILPWLKRKELIAILGVRRSGKTTLMYEIISHLLKSTRPENIFFIKADDDRVSKERIIDVSIDEYIKWHNPKGKTYVFIDEIHEIPGWKGTLKRIYDLEDYKIFITGSNASILKEDLGTSLAGRFAYFELFPFSFREYLSTKGIKIRHEKDMQSNKNSIRHLMQEYIRHGAFPEVVLEKRTDIKDQLIRYYFDSIFYRDIIKRANLRNPEKVEKLAKYLLQNISGLANYTRIGKLLGLTTDSVTEYIKAFENAYLLFPVNIYEFSYRKQIINPKKIYCIDTGIRNSIGFKFSQDAGKLYENLVFLRLLMLRKEIYYSRDNDAKCDFIIKKKQTLSAVQVAFDIETSKEREVRGLLNALGKLKIKSGMILTDNYEAREEISSHSIIFRPVWKWLLEK